jgi:hypothetical protein
MSRQNINITKRRLRTYFSEDPRVRQILSYLSGLYIDAFNLVLKKNYFDERQRHFLSILHSFVHDREQYDMTDRQHEILVGALAQIQVRGDYIPAVRRPIPVPVPPNTPRPNPPRTEPSSFVDVDGKVVNFFDW